MIPLDPKRQQLEKVILWAQQSLLDQIKERRIVIEIEIAALQFAHFPEQIPWGNRQP